MFSIIDLHQNILSWVIVVINSTAAAPKVYHQYQWYISTFVLTYFFALMYSYNLIHLPVFFSHKYSITYILFVFIVCIFIYLYQYLFLLFVYVIIFLGVLFISFTLSLCLPKASYISPLSHTPSYCTTVPTVQYVSSWSVCANTCYVRAHKNDLV